MKHALLIGINYTGTPIPLNGCINDIRNIYAVLTTQFNYDEKHVNVLTDETPTKPTSANIQTCIRNLVKQVAPGDTVLLYYSGHGSSVMDRNGDELDRRDEVMVPIDYLQSGVITDDWLFANFVAMLPKGAKAWIFTDCCNSGTLMDLKYNMRSQCRYIGSDQAKEYKETEWTNQFSYSIERSKDIQCSVCMFSGCLDPETSADAFIDNQSQGAFTWCLLQWLKQSKKAKAIDVLKYINCKLDIAGYSQNSQLSFTTPDGYNMPFEL